METLHARVPWVVAGGLFGCVACVKAEPNAVAGDAAAADAPPDSFIADAQSEALDFDPHEWVLARHHECVREEDVRLYCSGLSLPPLKCIYAGSKGFTYYGVCCIPKDFDGGPADASLDAEASADD